MKEKIWISEADSRRYLLFSMTIRLTERAQSVIKVSTFTDSK